MQKSTKLLLSARNHCLVGIIAILLLIGGLSFAYVAYCDAAWIRFAFASLAILAALWLGLVNFLHCHEQARRARYEMIWERCDGKFFLR